NGPHWTCPVPIGRCSTPCCPTPSRSPTRSTWCAWRTRSWMTAAGGSKTRRWGIGAARPTRCIGPRRLLTKADERLDEKGRTKLLGLLAAGDPQGEVKDTWHAKVIRSVYQTRL